MTVFVDASALVAMIAHEPEARDLEDALIMEEKRLTSAMALWEAARAIAGKTPNGIEVAFTEVKRFCGLLNLIAVPVGEAEASEAIRAHARYGKGTGHPARLNMGDCFAYACARTNDAKLLYKGDDFSQTDLG